MDFLERVFVVNAMFCSKEEKKQAKVPPQTMQRYLKQIKGAEDVPYEVFESLVEAAYDEAVTRIVKRACVRDAHGTEWLIRTWMDYALLIEIPTAIKNSLAEWRKHNLN